jgi:hypothetical protein
MLRAISLKGQTIAADFGRASFVAALPAIRKLPRKWSSVRIGDHPPATPEYPFAKGSSGESRSL